MRLDDKVSQDQFANKSAYSYAIYSNGWLVSLNVVFLLYLELNNSLLIKYIPYIILVSSIYWISNLDIVCAVSDIDLGILFLYILRQIFPFYCIYI